MGIVKIQCEFPFWLRAPFLIHTETQEARYEIFSAWKQEMESDKFSDKETAIRAKLSELRDNDPLNGTLWSRALKVLKEMQWNVEGFHDLKGAPLKDAGDLLLPTNISNQKGGVLIGKMNLTSIAKSPKARNLLSSLRIYFELKRRGLQDVTLDGFKLKNIHLEIMIYDWSSGCLTIEYEVEYPELRRASISGLRKLGNKLEGIFHKDYMEATDFKALLDRYPSLFKPMEELQIAFSEFQQMNPQDKQPPPFAFHGGYKNPFYYYFEYLIWTMVFLHPNKTYGWGAIETDGRIKDFFRNRLELKNGSKPESIKPFWEDIRYPYNATNYIFLPSDQRELRTLLRLNFGPLIDTGMDQPNPNAPTIAWKGRVHKTDSGFAGSYMILDPDCRINEDIQLLGKRTQWMWRLGILYFAMLHRIQAHLVTRKGIHLEVWGMVLDEDKNWAFVEDSVVKEIYRLEALRIAIEAIIQESSLVFLCDNSYYRAVYGQIRKKYLFDELVSQLRQQLPVLISDLHSDQEKRRNLSLRSLGTLVLFTSILAGILGYFTVLEIPFVKAWIREGWFYFFPLSKDGQIICNSLWVLLILYCSIGFVYCILRMLYTKEKFSRLFFWFFFMFVDMKVWLRKRKAHKLTKKTILS
jgi:hypothetical protein